ncbi:unnamed protein product [Prunus armeniaca]|uniref:Uncharacterized protein n=1 Tax=Prunus armeniaca TaxID=36596 RepID=A0A6J5UMU6_PRUAR|nr:unnamed protein product [Prunus armeniaca]
MELLVVDGVKLMNRRVMYDYNKGSFHTWDGRRTAPLSNSSSIGSLTTGSSSLSLLSPVPPLLPKSEPNQTKPTNQKNTPTNNQPNHKSNVQCAEYVRTVRLHRASLRKKSKK